MPLGSLALRDVLFRFPVADDLGAGALLVMPASDPPPNPSELLSSRNMVGLMQSLEEQSDTEDRRREAGLSSRAPQRAYASADARADGS